MSRVKGAKTHFSFTGNFCQPISFFFSKRKNVYGGKTDTFTVFPFFLLFFLFFAFLHYPNTTIKRPPASFFKLTSSPFLSFYIATQIYRFSIEIGFYTLPNNNAFFGRYIHFIRGLYVKRLVPSVEVPRLHVGTQISGSVNVDLKQKL